MRAKPPGERLPHCADCNAGEKVFPYPREDGVVSLPYVGHEWLCGSCRYKRDHPDAAPAEPLPREQKVPLQKETLFD